MCLCETQSVATKKLTSADGFVVLDLPDAPLAAGVVRCAPKILVDGATWMARSATYQYAFYGRKVSGASAAVNAANDVKAEKLPEAIAEFASSFSTLLLEPGRGVTAKDLEPLAANDVRGNDYAAQRIENTARGIVAAVAALKGGLSGVSVAIEIFDPRSVKVASLLHAGGAKIVAIGTSAGTRRDDNGLDLSSIEQEWKEKGADCAADSDPASAVFSVPCDVLLAGSKPGIIDDSLSVHASFIVPNGLLPVTAKALAALERNNVKVLPDFVVLAGHLAAWPENGSSTDAETLVSEAVQSLLSGDTSPFFAACERAEDFLASWSEIPFGRPIA